MVTPSPLLATKLHIPRPRPGNVARPRLQERLDRIFESKLTLISAPAGFGKSTLLGEWLAAAPRDERLVAWLSVDEADNEPLTFWTYLIAALQTVAPGIGDGALSLLESLQPRVQTALASLLNELAEAPMDVVLALDDYHVIDTPDIQEGVTYLLDHLPESMHLVIATRADPALPLARLRARGELVELRAADLRFTRDEAATYFNEVMGLDLGARDIARLEGRTEGWIAALQLAALSMQGREDLAGFIAAFAGDDRYIVDYLVGEILERQPEEVRRFLLQTSILSRLTGPLCDAVTGEAGSTAMLEALDRRNLFLVPLDDRRQWYRYHHLFADMLRARLLAEQPDSAHDLHRRASDWHERVGDRSEAIRHALAGEDFERAADLVELELPTLRQARALTTIRGWLRALPDHVYRARPVLSTAYAGALMADGEVADVEARLRAAERWLDATGRAASGSESRSPEMVVVDEEAFRLLPATIAIYRAAQSQGLGDAVSAMMHARRALDLTDEDDHFERGAAAGFLALAHWRSGELEAAHRYWTATMASLQKAGHAVDALGCIRPLAEIAIAQGRLREAFRLYKRGLRLATERGPSVLRGAADMHVGISGLFFEVGDLDASMQHLITSRELGDQAGLALNPSRWHAAMARIRAAEGDLQGALELLDEAERLYVGEFYPDVRPVAALRARIWLAQGRLAEAMAWASDRGLSVEDDLSYGREFEHITLARLLEAQAEQASAERPSDSAVELLHRLLAAAEQGQRLGSVIEILVLQALGRQRRGSMASALVPLERALALAEPEGYVRTFVDDGAPLAALLDAAAKNGIAVDYVRRLLAAHDRADSTSIKQALAEPLSKRELDVLRLLATELDGPGIAGELFVGVSTVRSHTKSIYAKLGVNSRRAAVRRGEELGLLRRGSST
jgi:LuxR family transcriptional regulator, maltose regulon positive regulatory protein